MRTRLLLPVLLLGLAGLAPQAAAAAEAVPAQVARLIEQLGSTDFAVRERAGRELEAVGLAALPELRRAANGDDPEVRRRAETLARRLEAREVARKLLTPSHVRLIYKDAPLREALDDLQRKTGAQFLLHDPDNRLAERRVTVDTGDTTVWEAVDQFCHKAGLTDAGTSQQALGSLAVSRRGLLQAPLAGVPVQAAQLQVQVQIINGALVQRTVGVPTPPAGPVALVDSKGRTAPTHYAGAVRIRAVPADNPAATAVARHADEVAVTLEAAAEPHLAWLGALSVHVDRAADDAGQQLVRCWTPVDTTLTPPAPFVRTMTRTYAQTTVGPQSLGLLFKKGDRPSKVLKELSGSILAQVQTEPEPIITVDKVLQAAGRTVRGSEGGSIKVLQAGKVENGLMLLRVQVENPPDVSAAALPVQARNVAGGGRAQARLTALAGGCNGLQLLDDKGNPVQMFPMRTQVQSTPAGILWDYTFGYQTGAGSGEPATLVFAGCRTVTISIPFALTDVPLP
jgi:hypothetical protein